MCRALVKCKSNEEVTLLPYRRLSCTLCAGDSDEGDRGSELKVISVPGSM
jgi:hypothetical protein